MGDYSLKIYEKYSNLNNKEIELICSDGSRISGMIAGFFKGDPYSNEAYVTKWHIATKEQTNKLADDEYSFVCGKIIASADILEVRFLEDNSVIKFKPD